MPKFAAWDDTAAHELIEARKAMPGALLPILHALQERFGYVDASIVISFYHDFRDHPPGEHVVKLCRAEACQAMGNERLIDHAKRRLGVDFHETTADGRFSLEAVYCLGNCACAPALTIDNKVYGRIDPARLDQLLDDAGKRP